MTQANTALSSRILDATGGTRSARRPGGPPRRALADYRRYRATLSELRGLDDAQLADLGMERRSLPRIARLAVYGH